MYVAIVVSCSGGPLIHCHYDTLCNGDGGSRTVLLGWSQNIWNLVPDEACLRSLLRLVEWRFCGGIRRAQGSGPPMVSPRSICLWFIVKISRSGGKVPASRSRMRPSHVSGRTDIYLSHIPLVGGPAIS